MAQLKNIPGTKILVPLLILVPLFTLIPFDPQGQLRRFWYVNLFVTPKTLSLGVICLLFWLHTQAKNRRNEIDLNFFEGALLVYCLCGIISALINGVDWTKALSSLAIDLLAIGLYFCLKIYLNGLPSPKNPFVDSIILGSTLTAGIVLSEALGIKFPWAVHSRPVGTLGSRYCVANYLVIALPFLWFKIFSRPIGPHLFQVHLIQIVILLTRSRSALISSALAIGLSYIVERWKLKTEFKPQIARANLKIMFLSILTSVLIAVVIPWPGLKWKSPSPYTDTLENLFDSSTGSGRWRVGQHLTGFRMFRDFPALGVGSGNWSTYAPLYESTQANTHKGEVPYHQSPHSEWLRVLLERGILGLTFFLCFGVGPLVNCLFRLFKKPSSYPPDIFPVLIGSLVLLVDSSFAFSWSRPEILVVNIAFLAVLNSFNKSSPYSIRLRLPIRLLEWGISIAIMASLTVFLLQNLALLELIKKPGYTAWANYSRIWPYPQHQLAGLEVGVREGYCQEIEKHLNHLKDIEPNWIGPTRLLDQCSK